MVTKNDYDSYFFNNLYNDELIGDKLAAFQNRLYNNILSGKEWIQNNRIINGDLDDVKIDQALNKEFNMPEGTYSLHLNTNIIPFYSEKAFFDKHKYGEVISSTEIMRDHKIFSKSFYFFINNSLIYDTKVAIMKDRCIIFIAPTSEDTPSDLCRSDLDKFIDDDSESNMWTVMLGTKADYYATTMARALLFSDNKIYLSKLTDYKNYSKPNKSNCWTMYITASGSSYNIMNATSVTLGSDSTGEYFLVPEAFKEDIYSKANSVRCLIVNEPECSGSGIYINTEGTNPIFQIPFKKNPIPKRNLLVWAYDSDTKRKLHPLEVSADLKYPNIYDFGAMIDDAFYEILYTSSKELVVGADYESIVFGSRKGSAKHYDLYIEWIEPMEDCSAYDSYIQDFMNFYSDDYAGMIVNGTLPEYVKDYHPIVDPKLGAFDYFNSEYKGDYRAWRLANLIKLLQDNPKRYDELFHRLYYLSKQYTTRTYTYATEPHIYEREITDNKDHCDNANDSLMKFSKPQKFIRFYDYRDEVKPVNLFVGGLFKRTTYVMKYGSTLFIYFDSDLATNQENLQIDIESINNNRIIKPILFNRADSTIDMETLEFTREVSLGNLVFYVTDTGEYINKDDLSFNAQVSIADIQYIGTDKVDTTSELTTEMVLYDNSSNLVVPVGNDYIVLKVTRVNHEVSDNDSSQEVNLDNVEIGLTGGESLKYVRKSLSVATTDFYQQKVFTIPNGAITEDGYQYTFENFVGKPSKNRFRVFNNGLRILPDKFTIEFTGYMEDAIFTFDSSIVPGETVIQYVGFDELNVFSGIIGDLNKTNDGILYLSEILDTPFDTLAYKIFIDGYRISDDQIKMVGQSNMIMIDTPYHYTNESTIAIYQQKNDEDLYDYDSESQFLDKVAMNDENFRRYLIAKYK